MDRRDTHQLTPTFKVELFERIARGHGGVGVRLEHQLTDGSKEEFRTDLARLEYIVKRAEEFQKSSKRDIEIEEAGDTNLRFKFHESARHGETTAVTLSQMARDGSGEQQKLSAYSHDLKRAVKEGLTLENELGYGERWHTLVNEASFRQTPDGRIYADATKSFESEVDAREFLGKNKGHALILEPQRRKFEKAESVELWNKADVLVEAQTYSRSVESQLEQCKGLPKRQGPEQEKPQPVSNELKDNSFGMDRQKYTKGYSM
jgi:hypothetical protein